MTSSNPIHRQCAVMLERAGKEQKAPIWATVASLLARPGRMRVEVNIGRLSKIAGEGQALFVPGKVLGTGVVDKKLVVGAFSFSCNAKSKLEAAKGSALTVEEFLKKYPRGSGVRLVK